MPRLMLKDEHWSKLRTIMREYGIYDKQHQGIGKSRGGNTTKIHMGVDSFGLPIGFKITGGEVHDC